MFTSRRRVFAAVVLTIAAVVWLLVNGPVEGKILVAVTPDHGLTEADLPALATLMVAAMLLISARR